MIPILTLTAWMAGALEQEAPAQEAPAPAAGAPKSSKKENEKPPDQEARLKELERQVQLLRLQAPEEGATSANQPQQSAASASANAFNPTVTVIGNTLYRYDDRAVTVDDARIDSQFNLRELELDLRAAVDPFADAVGIVAFPSEVPGEFSAEVEEGYVIIKHLPLPVLDEPPLGLKLKLGRFRTEMGRINRLHLHDLPQMTRPLVNEVFLGEDGYIGNGLSAEVSLPAPFDEASALDLTAQALTGGGVPFAEGPPRAPGFVGNLRWFRTFASAHDVDLSFIFAFGRTDPQGNLSATIYSGDFLYRWKPLRQGEFRSFLLGGQLFYGPRTFLEAVDTNGDGQPDASVRRKSNPLGYFAWSQYQLTRSTYLGVRWDDSTTLASASERARGITAYLTWYTSEFLRFRFAYQHRWSDIPAEDGLDSAFGELVFVFGAHPPEPFWVNK
jgi:hypothetical protein